MVVNFEKQINQILAERGYVMKYQETFPSSEDDMYEFKVWFEDNKLNKYPFRILYIRNVDKKPDFNYKRKALTLLLNIFIRSYFEDIDPLTKKKNECY